jgi:hypothetical protein
MSRRLTLAVPVILAASVAAVSFSATTGDAADECLSGPKGTAPQGSHWYYRVDRPTGRHCWYLGSQGQKVRSVSERTSQQTRRRVEQHSERTETTAPEPVRSIAPPAVAETKTVASFFSQYWSSLFSGAEPPKIATAEEAKLAPAVDAGRAAPASATSSFAQEQDQTDAQEEMPLVWPVLTPAEREAAAAPAANSAPKSATVPVPAFALGSQHMVAVLVGALALAGILMALVYRLGSIRFSRKQQQRQTPRWDITSQTVPPLPLSYGEPVARSSVPVRRPALPRRPAELDRDGREPSEARRIRELRELREGLENKLEELRDAHKRSAA